MLVPCTGYVSSPGTCRIVVPWHDPRTGTLAIDKMIQCAVPLGWGCQLFNRTGVPPGFPIPRPQFGITWAAEKYMPACSSWGGLNAMNAGDISTTWRSAHVPMSNHHCTQLLQSLRLHISFAAKAYPTDVLSDEFEATAEPAYAAMYSELRTQPIAPNIFRVDNISDHAAVALRKSPD
jgi:hypothetical protein